MTTDLHYEVKSNILFHGFPRCDTLPNSGRKTENSACKGGPCFKGSVSHGPVTITETRDTEVAVGPVEIFYLL